MGYTHYWGRPAVIAPGAFHSLQTDFERLILPLADQGVELAGGLGVGVPEINAERIRFNGRDECGHPKNDEIVIPYPSEHAEGIGPNSTAVDAGSDGLVTRVKHRCCNGRCSFETFHLPRVLDLQQRDEEEDGLYIDCVKTGFRPYDVGVTSVLLIAKRHLRDRFEIQSNGNDHHWADARRLCQRILGYGDWFGIVEQQIVEEWPGNPPRKRDVLLRTLVELDPAALV